MLVFAVILAICLIMVAFLFARKPSKEDLIHEKRKLENELRLINAKFENGHMNPNEAADLMRQENTIKRRLNDVESQISTLGKE